MKAECNREGLLAAFQLASAAVPSKEVKPILKNLKAIAEDGRCTLMATDLELGIRLEVRGLEVEEPGEAILPAKKFQDILRESFDEKLTVEADASVCVVRNDSGSEWEMLSEDPANFPDLPAFTEQRYHQVPAGILRTMIRRTAFAAAAQESSRWQMSGVLWETESDKVRLVATDGKRLATTEGPAEVHGGHTTRGQTPVVPVKAMTLLERNLQDDAEQVRISFRPNEVLFQTERAVIYSRLVEGRYPNWRDVLPKKQAAKIPLLCAPFLASVRQSSILADEETKKVIFHFARKKLSLEARGATTGRSRVEMLLDYEGKPVDISFNTQYVIDFLRVLDADAEITLELVDGNTPALFRAGEDYSYVIMPLS